ncbi:hypothetical protein D9M72_618260 [compost metagenome]
MLTLTNQDGDVILRRVISGEQLRDEEQGEEAFQAIRRDLAVQEGRIEDDVIVALRQRTGVLHYGT